MWVVYIVMGGEVLVLSYFKVRYHSGLALSAGFYHLGPRCDKRNAQNPLPQNTSSYQPLKSIIRDCLLVLEDIYTPKIHLLK